MVYLVKWNHKAYEYIIQRKKEMWRYKTLHFYLTHYADFLMCHFKFLSQCHFFPLQSSVMLRHFFWLHEYDSAI